MVKEDRHGISQSDFLKFKTSWEENKTPTDEYLSGQEYGIKTESKMRFESEDRLMKYLLFWFVALLILFVVKLYMLNN